MADVNEEHVWHFKKGGKNEIKFVLPEDGNPIVMTEKTENDSATKESSHVED